MMSIFSKLFGSNKVVDAAIKAGDVIFYTDEEKSEWKLRMLKAYEPFKIAQRYLAVILSIPFVGLHALAGIQILIAGWFTGATGKNIHEASLALMEINNETLGMPVSIVLGFYFAGGLAEGAFRAKNGKD